MSSAVFWCSLNCLHCWRQHRYILPPGNIKWDKPEEILDGCIKEQTKLLEGFWGIDSSDKKRLREAAKPNQVAISLAGEPALYPYLPEFVDEVLGRDMTAYMVTNGTIPDMVEKLIEHQPTNLYISVYGYDNETYRKACAPIIKNAFENVLESLALLKEFKCNTVVRLTLTKGINMMKPELYADIIEKAEPKFVECKGFMAVGGARERVGVGGMPSHQEIREFANIIEEDSSYKIKDEKSNSRVVLLSAT